MKQWIAGLGKRLGNVLASDNRVADARRRRQRIVGLGLERLRGHPPDKASQRAVLKRQREIDTLLHRLGQEGEGSDLSPLVHFDGLSRLQPFQASRSGYLLVYVQSFLTGLLERLRQTPRPLASVVFRPHEDPTAHIPILRRGHGLAFELLFFPEEEAAILCEFAGEMTAVSAKAANFAVTTQAPVLPLWCRVGGQGLTLEVAPPLEGHETERSLTLAMVEHFERCICLSPEEMDWEADCWCPPVRRLLPSRFSWPFVPRPGRTIQELRPFRLLVRVPDSFREACLAIPAVRAIKRGRPDVHLTVLTTEAMVPLWRLLPECDACLDLQAPPSDEDAFALGIILNGNKAALSQVENHAVGQTIGMENHPAADQFDQPLSMPRKLGPPEHRHRTYLRLAQRMGGSVEDEPGLHSPIATHQENGADGLLLGLAPESDDGPAYAWPSERFMEILRHTAKMEPKIRWRVLLRPYADSGPWEVLRAQLRPNFITLVATSTSVEDRLAALRGCRLLLAIDNAYLHLASAIYGIQTLAIYGPTEPIESAPVNTGSITLRKHVECTPCFLPECPIDHRCLNEIEVPRVLDALQASLRSLR